MDAALAKLAGAETTAAQTAALELVAKFVAANLPIIPTTTASQWFECNSQNYVGWPTQGNPYGTGQPSGTSNGSGSGTDEVVILHLRPRRSGVNREPPVSLRPTWREVASLERTRATPGT